MLIDKCTACHQTGGVGPWAMTSYDMVKGFAPMIREVVRTQRMPPWHADPHYGVWQNTRALTDDQRKLLVHWIEAGAPRGAGDGSAAGREAGHERVEARQARPDRRSPGVRHSGDRRDRVSVSARQESARPRRVDHRGGNPSRREAGDPSHHRAGSGRAERPAARRNGGGNLAGFAPGMSPIVYPANTGVLFPKDADFVFQMHYTPNGKAVTDHSKVGFYFREAERSAEVSAAPDRADGLPLPDSAGREGVRHDDDARRSRATCSSTTSCRTRTCAARRER